MHPLARAVGRTIARRALYAPSERVAVALSGGPDSVALAVLLCEIEAGGGAPVAGLIHVNHRLRGRESDEDEQFCRALAARIGRPIEVATIDVAALARARRQSIEVAAREARYRVFDDAAHRLGASVVATGHTIEDQAETVLLRLLRGAGTRGLSGIRPRRGRFVRPLIDCHRADLVRYLSARGEAFREDSTNRDVTIPRNRVRHELLPTLLAIAPGGVRALARLASHAADDEAFLQAAAIEIRPSIVLSKEETDAGVRTVISAERLWELPPAMGRRLVRDLIAEIAPGQALSSRHLDAVRALARADSPGEHLDLPGVIVRRTGRLLTLSRARPAGEPRVGRRARSGNPVVAARPLALPGAVSLPEAGVTITATVGTSMAGAGRQGALPAIARLQAASVTPPLEVRFWRAGDRFRPLGAPGRRKVQDLFVDRKVPREERLRVPIVVDATGRILWVAGVAVAEECRVTAPEAGVVILEMRKP